MKTKLFFNVKRFTNTVKIITVFCMILSIASSVHAQFWGNNGFLVHSESLITGNMDLNPHSAAFKVGNTLYFTDYYGFNIYDISDMANPFPIAAVVLPTASSVSARSRTLLPSPAISAIPAALSATGP